VLQEEVDFETLPLFFSSNAIEVFSYLVSVSFSFPLQLAPCLRLFRPDC